MPIFEYDCKGCGVAFEQLVQGAGEPACPSCASTELEKKLSSFAVSAGAMADRVPAGPCGTCGDPRGAGAGAMD